MNPWMWCAMLPMLTFFLLLVAEKRTTSVPLAIEFDRTDWILNLSGFFMQGLVIPLVGFALATFVFPTLAPQLHKSLQIGFAGAFLLNFVFIDFLYYLQHRAFHQIPALWKLHSPHHYSPVVNVWATSRNALVTHFLFVYLLVSPIFAYLCDATEGYFAGAMLTAALDLFRHSRVNLRIPILENILVMPHEHHRHHDFDKAEANYGANLIIWDKIFGTFESSIQFPCSYVGSRQPSFQTQLLQPWKSS